MLKEWQLWCGGIHFNPSAKEKTIPRDAFAAQDESATGEVDRVDCQRSKRWDMPAEVESHVPVCTGEVARRVGGDLAKNLGGCYLMTEDQKDHLQRKIPLMKTLPVVAVNPPVLAWLASEGMVSESQPTEYARIVSARKDKLFRPAILEANVALYAAASTIDVVSKHTLMSSALQDMNDGAGAFSGKSAEEKLALLSSAFPTGGTAKPSGPFAEGLLTKQRKKEIELSTHAVMALGTQPLIEFGVGSYEQGLSEMGWDARAPHMRRLLQSMDVPTDTEKSAIRGYYKLLQEERQHQVMVGAIGRQGSAGLSDGRTQLVVKADDVGNGGSSTVESHTEAAKQEVVADKKVEADENAEEETGRAWDEESKDTEWQSSTQNDSTWDGESKDTGWQSSTQNDSTWEEESKETEWQSSSQNNGTWECPAFPGTCHFGENCHHTAAQKPKPWKRKRKKYEQW